MSIVIPFVLPLIAIIVLFSFNFMLRRAAISLVFAYLFAANQHIISGYYIAINHLIDITTATFATLVVVVFIEFLFEILNRETFEKYFARNKFLIKISALFLMVIVLFFNMQASGFKLSPPRYVIYVPHTIEKSALKRMVDDPLHAIIHRDVGNLVSLLTPKGMAPIYSAPYCFDFMVKLCSDFPSFHRQHEEFTSTLKLNKTTRDHLYVYKGHFDRTMKSIAERGAEFSNNPQYCRKQYFADKPFFLVETAIGPRGLWHSYPSY